MVVVLVIAVLPRTEDRANVTVRTVVVVLVREWAVPVCQRAVHTTRVCRA